MWLSLVWPGAGHLYAGDVEKGAILSGVTLVLLLLAATVIGATLGLLAWLAAALYAGIDSGRAVDARNARAASGSRAR
jgi:TM2 domain-containing membrane protein YozV